MFAIFNVGFRDKYVELCRLAIQSLHIHHPEIKILVVADEHMVKELKKEEYATIILAPRCHSLWQILRRKCDILELAKPYLFPGVVLYIDSDLVVRSRFDSWLNTIREVQGLHALAEGKWENPWWSPQRFSLDETELDKRTFNNGIMGFHYPDMIPFFREVALLMDQFPGETSDQVYFNAVAAREHCLHTSLPAKSVRLFASYEKKTLKEEIFVHACGLGTDPAEKLSALQTVSQPS